MAKIDRFIQQLSKAGAERLVLASGDKGALVKDSEVWPVTPDAIAEPQILAFLAEILPADLRSSVAAGKSVVFTYTSPHGPVGVTVEPAQGRARLVLHLVDAGTQDPVAATHASPPIVGGSRTTQPVTAASAPGRSAEPRMMIALFRKMMAEACSDLHISTGNPPLYRKDGDMVALGGTAPLTVEQSRELLLSICPALDKARFEELRDVDFSYDVPGLARFRCNLFMDRRGMGGVFRAIPTKIPSAQDLGLSRHILDLCHLNKGLIVVTGPTGSGKSTTLAAMIDYINHNIRGHLITIEDPIEFVHENKKCLINQREVGDHTRDFKAALRAALREDPDFVMVGEMRDLETVAIAIETAETGHLVFGTLHTNTAPSAVDRIIDQFSADRQAQVRAMVSESLRGVIAQVLCKKKGGGRVAAQEVLLVNPAVSNLIREGKTFQIPSIMQTGKGVGMVCLNDALLDLVQRGLVEPAEAYAKSVARTEFKALLSRGGIAVGGA